MHALDNVSSTRPTTRHAYNALPDSVKQVWEAYAFYADKLEREYGIDHVAHKDSPAGKRAHLTRLFQKVLSTIDNNPNILFILTNCY